MGHHVSAGRRGKNWDIEWRDWVDDLEHRQVAGGWVCRVQKGKELNDFQRNLLDIEILSNLRFGSLEIRDTSVTRVTNNFLICVAFCLSSGVYRTLLMSLLGAYRVLSDLSDLATTISVYIYLSVCRFINILCTHVGGCRNMDHNWCS